MNKLIQDGAHPVTSVNDILERLNLYMVPQQTEVQKVLPANAEERALLAVLSSDAHHIDELARSSGLPVSVVAATLTTLELKGIVKPVGGMHYVLAR